MSEVKSAYVSCSIRSSSSSTRRNSSVAWSFSSTDGGAGRSSAAVSGVAPLKNDAFLLPPGPRAELDPRPSVAALAALADLGEARFLTSIRSCQRAK